MFIFKINIKSIIILYLFISIIYNKFSQNLVDNIHLNKYKNISNY